MKMKLCLLLLLNLTLTKINLTNSQSTTSCNNYSFKSSPNNTNTKLTTTPLTFTTCIQLPFLHSFLHYNYYPTNSTLEIAYRHTKIDPSTHRWISWAINPTGPKMSGSQSLVAYVSHIDGSMVVYTSSISSYKTSLKRSELSFNVSNLSAMRIDDEFIIFATLDVPKHQTVVNQVWQDGPLSYQGKPMIHDTSGPNLLSVASLNLLSGVAAAVDGVGSASRLKNIHGILNALSWGILMPMGAITARYMKILPSAAWFNLHVGCQLSAYFLGVAGWVTGLKLGSASHGIVQELHRNIGIALFTLATIQIFALFIRPKPDHKYRFYWNVYHHSFGYTIIILSIINILEGFKILQPKEIWKTSYVGVIVVLGIIVVLLEAITWFIVYKRRRNELE